VREVFLAVTGFESSFPPSDADTFFFSHRSLLIVHSIRLNPENCRITTARTVYASSAKKQAIENRIKWNRLTAAPIWPDCA